MKNNIKLKIIITTLIGSSILNINNVNAKELSFWTSVKNGLENLEPNINYETKNPQEYDYISNNLENFYIDIQEQDINSFYANNLYSFKQITDKSKQNIKLKELLYKHNNDDIVNLDKAVKSKIATFKGKNNIEKLEEAYQTVLKDLTYGFQCNGPKDGICNINERNAWQGLQNKKVVCEAYAHYMALFLDELGFENKIVTGTVKDANKEEAHMWNIAKVEGKWYVIDATWGDFENKEIQKRYFLAGKENLNRHKFNIKAFEDLIENKSFNYNPKVELQEIQKNLEECKYLLNKIEKIQIKNNQENILIKEFENTTKIKYLNLLEKYNNLNNQINNIKEENLAKIDINFEKEIFELRNNIAILNNDYANLILNQKIINNILSNQKLLEEDKETKFNYQIKNILEKDHKFTKDIENSKLEFVEILQEQNEILNAKNLDKINIEKIFEITGEKETKKEIINKHSNDTIPTTNKISGYAKGYSDNTFKPNNKVTRAEAVSMFARLINGSDNFNNSDNKFSDVDGWYKDAVNFISEKGLMNGYSDGTFKPNNEMTRAEFATMISKYINAGNIEKTFIDINGHWAKEAIEKVLSAGIINGYPNGEFKPDATITRAESIAILNRVFNKTNVETKVDFSDVNESDWFYEEIAKATN